MSKNDGGPAFPVSEELDRSICTGSHYGSLGMTLRDYFAAKAMQALTQALLRQTPSLGDWFPAEISAMAYQQADAMLAERDK